MFIDFLIYFSHNGKDFTGVVTQREENSIPYYRIVLKCEGKLSILRIVPAQPGMDNAEWKHKQKKIALKNRETEEAFLGKIREEIEKHGALAATA